MRQIIICKKPDGGVYMLSPAPGVTLEYVLANDVPPGYTDARIVDESILPEDRQYRGAWKDNGASVGIDLEKAKAVHKETLKREVLSKSKKLEEEIAVAEVFGTQQEVNALTAKKNKIKNDAKALNLNSITTIEDLKAAWPVDLEKPKFAKKKI